MRAIAVSLMLVFLTACNTVEGVKEDAYKADQAIQNTVKKIPE
jgi:predicted small secreted protein